MSMLVTKKEGKERLEKFLIANQYQFTIKHLDSGWLFVIE